MAITHHYVNYILLVVSFLSKTSLASVCNVGDKYPSAEITSSIAGDVIPVGYNVTLDCEARKANTFGWRRDNSLVYVIHWFDNNDRYVLTCGGDFQKDKEEVKTCALHIANGSTRNSGNYTCQASSAYECTESIRQLTWKEPISPTFTIHPRDLSNVTVGSDVILTCEAAGIPQPRITWWKGDLELRNANINSVGGRSSLAIINVTEENDGTYRCVANSLVGSAESIFSRITVATKPEIIVHPKSRTVNSATNVTLKCEARGFPEPDIGWLKNNEPLVNATVVRNQSQSLLILRSFDAEKDDGNYSCVAVNFVGVTYSNEAVIQVHQFDSTQLKNTQLKNNDQSQPSSQSTNIRAWYVVTGASAAVLAALTALLARMIYKRKKTNEFKIQAHFMPARKPGQEDPMCTRLC